MRRPLFVFAAGLSLLLTACVAEPAAVSPTPLASETLAALPERPAVEFRSADSVSIPGLRTVTDGDNGSLVYTVIPQIEGYDRLNERLRDVREQDTRDVVDTISAGGAASRGSVNVSWRTLGSAPRIVGFLISSIVSPGASTAVRERSVWYDAAEDRLLGWRDLVRREDHDAVVDDVLAQLRRYVTQPDLASAQDILRSGDPAVGFTATGDLVLQFDEYDVAAGAEGAPAFAVSVSESSLTASGKAAREATLRPQPLEAAPEPPPVPERVDCRVAKCVALTFDDGPSGRTTPRLLDLLEREDVHATFFVLGTQAQAYPKILRRIAADGHEIGNHSWSHPDLTRLDPEDALSQMRRTSRAIEKATGRAPDLLRPPYGARDKKLDALARGDGYAEVLWSIDTRDWENHSPKKIIAAAKKAKRGAIILMHDIHADTVDAVPGVVAALRKKGFTLVTVSDLLGTTQAGKRYYGRY